jgi:hypothetical protein
MSRLGCQILFLSCCLASTACNDTAGIKAPSNTDNVGTRHSRLQQNLPWIALRNNLMTGCLKRVGFLEKYAWAPWNECLQLSTANGYVESNNAFYFERCTTSACVAEETIRNAEIHLVKGRTGGCLDVYRGHVVENTCHLGRSSWWVRRRSTISSVNYGALGLKSDGSIGVGAGGSIFWLWVPTFSHNWSGSYSVGTEIRLQHDHHVKCIDAGPGSGTATVLSVCGSAASQKLMLLPRSGNRFWLRTNDDLCLTIDDASADFIVETGVCADNNRFFWHVRHVTDAAGVSRITLQHASHHTNFLGALTTAGNLRAVLHDTVSTWTVLRP